MADTPQTRESRRFLVSGIVQGVGYRYFAMRAAQRLGLSGYARNLPDGRVEVYAVGGASKLGELRNELERGPQGASVAAVAEEEAALNPEFAKGFSIEH
jgi:acylphosphatase